MAAGSYVEIHGGPYTGNQLTIVANGTASNPIWIRGGGSGQEPVIQRETIINGSYIILEYLKFDTQRKTLAFRYKTTSVNYACIRNSTFIGTGINDGNTAVINIYGSATYPVSNIVVYNNKITNFGDKSSSTENDYHGILPGEYSSHVWILNNNVSFNAGDSIQIGQAQYTPEQRPQFVFVGDNIFHEDRENAVDIKRAQNVVIASNICYGYHYVNSSDGTIIIIHDNPENVWIVNNIVHSGTHGIVTTGSIDTYFVGNIIYNIHRDNNFPWTPTSAYADGAAIHFRGATTGGAINNTIFDYDIGIQLTQGNSYEIINNLLAYRAETNGVDLNIANSSLAANSNIDHMLFPISNSSAILISGKLRTLDDIRTSYNKCTNCLEAEPLFISPNPTSPNLAIRPTSPARNFGKEHSVYALFEQRFPGLSIRKDRNGTTRPADGVWDIGALEWTDATLHPPEIQSITQGNP